MSAIDSVIRSIVESKLQASGSTLITIDGPAGAGKTTLAEILKSELRQKAISVEIIHMDDLYDGWDNALGPKLGRALEDIAQQSHGKEIIHPIYNWAQKKFTRVKSIPTPQVLILEGVGAGRKEIREKTSLSIWVDIEPSLGVHRAISRDGEVIAPFMETWSQKQAEYFAEHHTRENASFTIVME